MQNDNSAADDDSTDADNTPDLDADNQTTPAQPDTQSAQVDSPADQPTAEPAPRAAAAAENDDDIDVEFDESDPLTAQAEVVRLTLRVAELERDRKDLEKRAADAGEQTRQYAAAYDKARVEFDAAKTRLAREQERGQKRQLAKAVTGLLGVLDNFDRFLDSAKQAAAAGGSVGQSFFDGAAMIRGQFDQALQQIGLQRFDGVGERFDPERHQAVTTMTVLDAAQDGLVIHGVSAGAVLGDEVVRPANVVVGKCLAVGSDAVN